MSGPVIGLCTAQENARWAAWDMEAVLLPRNYVDRVQGTGAIALLLPPDPAAVEDPDRLLDLVDGLLLAGGADLDPASYGAEPHAATAGSVPFRDAFEIALTRRAMERDMPVLGVCRGMQVMNVARGGTLDQHLPDSVGHERHRAVLGSFEGADHEVELEPGSLAARAAGTTSCSTKSHHHQAVDRLGDGFLVTGHAPFDGLAEAFELPAARFALGIQWHAEATPGDRIIDAFVAAARAARDAGGARSGAGA